MTAGTRDETHWHRWFLLIWALICGYLLYYKWNAIHWFALSDTDDNMRFAQVRAWLAGQPWYDLRQYRLDPPGGASIHWSRIVDLPIVALMLLIRPFTGAQEAARWACALAPLLALGAGLYATMLAARRLVSPNAFFLAAALLTTASATLLMWMPLRIDHHGWQLAALMWTIAGIADRRQLRGGLTAGGATVFSLAIGLELMLYLATAGALTALWWVLDRTEAERLRAYGIALAGGGALAYALFASWDNAAPRCDALTPVYLSALLEAGAVLVLLSSIPARGLPARALLAVVAGAALAGAFATSWPQCLGRPEQVSPELERLWLSHVREAKPLYQHGWRVIFPTLSLSLIGLVGTALAWWRARGSERALPWAVVALLSLFSTLLLLWQTRAGPSSQLIGVIGATALGQPLLAWTLAHHRMAVRVLGTAAGFVLISGAFAGLTVRFLPEKKTAYRRSVDAANRRCPTLPALKPIAALPRATVLTFIDFGPRLIAVTPHAAIAGPYHRAGSAILDVQHAFRAPDPAVAYDVMRRHGATLLLICPGMSESTVYASEAPKGFYAQLAHGHAPRWLAPVPLPASSPFKLWRWLG